MTFLASPKELIVRYRTINSFGEARNVITQDLNKDGRRDILLVKNCHHNSGNCNTNSSYYFKLLWRDEETSRGVGSGLRPRSELAPCPNLSIQADLSNNKKPSFSLLDPLYA